MAAGYRGYDPTAIPKRFQLREGFSFGGIGDFVAVLKEHAEVKISAAKEGVQTAFTKMAGANSVEEVPKWKIALAIGVPIGVGMAAIWYYKNKSPESGGPPDERPHHVPRMVDPDRTDVDSVLSETSVLTEFVKDPIEKAQARKNRGNKYFKAGRYEAAIDCYTRAIDVCPDDRKQDIATFYQNRAAAQEQLKKYDAVVMDCTKALEYNNRYTKALFRRAKACEITNDLMQCLEDVTAVCILESFENQQSLLMADRVLKELGKTKAKEAYKKRGPVEPSQQFIRTYFSTFRNDPVIAAIYDKSAGDTYEFLEKDRDESPEKEKNADSPFQKAINDLRMKHYGRVVQLCHEEIERHLPNAAMAQLLRATFHLIRGEALKAADDLDKLLAMPDVDKRIRSNALIKRGSLKMQNGQQTEALEDFEIAVKEDPENSDVYHHRGQLNLLIERVDEAVRDFEKCVQLSPEFAVASVQKCYTEYRSAFASRSPMHLQSAMRGFEATIKKFPACAEGYALYGQALCDQQIFDRADENFQKALELEPDNGNIYVHRGLLALQWKQDADEASRLINQAIKVDDRCEFAYETLGTIEVQRGNLSRAVELFNKSISLAKTEIEMAHLYSLLDAAVAQMRVAKNFGIQVPFAGVGMM